MDGQTPLTGPPLSRHHTLRVSPAAAYPSAGGHAKPPTDDHSGVLTGFPQESWRGPVVVGNESGRWMVDPWKDQLHWVEGGPRKELARFSVFDVFDAVCHRAALVAHRDWLDWPRCPACVQWLVNERPCSQCAATGAVRSYRQWPGQLAVGTEQCDLCGGHGCQTGLTPTTVTSLRPPDPGGTRINPSPVPRVLTGSTNSRRGDRS